MRLTPFSRLEQKPVSIRICLQDQNAPLLKFISFSALVCLLMQQLFVSEIMIGLPTLQIVQSFLHACLTGSPERQPAPLLWLLIRALDFVFVMSGFKVANISTIILKSRKRKRLWSRLHFNPLLTKPDPERTFSTSGKNIKSFKFED